MVGGAERYIAATVAPLSDLGHECRLWFTHGVTAESEDATEQISCPSEWLGPQPASAAAKVAAWRPDLICVHSQIDQRLEEELLSVAPAVFFAHAYAGACISGGKTLHDPVARPCGRTLGPGCLLHYYPHRCGGLDPRTMFRDFARNRAQIATLREYAAVITFSTHMQREYLRHGLAARGVKLIPPFSPGESLGTDSSRIPQRTPMAGLGSAELPLELGFLGRLVPQKGVDLLIQALPRVADKTGRRLHLIIAGDGQERAALGKLAADVMRADSRTAVEFREWISPDAMDLFYSEIQLLVVPSVWPEPFGLVGVEAAERGIPAAAFAVGGIPDWLENGRNGYLAPANPPTSESLAVAIANCVADSAHYEQLRDGALAVAKRFSGALHMERLMTVLSEVP